MGYAKRSIERREEEGGGLREEESGKLTERSLKKEEIPTAYRYVRGEDEDEDEDEDEKF